MMTLYTQAGCPRCRKVKQWLKEQNIPFLEKSLYSLLLEKEQLARLIESAEYLSIMDSGLQQKVLADHNSITWIQKNPSVIYRPLISIDQNDPDLTAVNILRGLKISKNCSSSCNTYLTCHKVRKEDQTGIVISNLKNEAPDRQLCEDL